MAIIGIKLDPTGCGWAVADKKFDVLNVRGKDLIGTRVYGKADIAQERRIKRSERRRKAAIQRRIAFLDDIFRDSLEEEYPGFMENVKKSGLKEDALKQFSFSDKYPTIHHAKKAVKEGSETDLRIIYLVLLYTMKHRGHFNYRGSVADIQNITYSYAAYRKELSAYGITFADDKDTINSLSQILLSSVPTKEKINQLKVLLDTGNDKAAAGAITLMTGGMTDLRLFFPEAYEDAEKTDGKVKFSDGSDFDEVKLDLEAFLTAEEMKLVTAARQIYDWMQMKKLLGSEKSFTDAFVASYDAHRSDLTELKKLCKELKPYDKDIYKDIFFDKTRKDGYAAYIGMGYNPKNQCRFTCEAADFYGFLTKRLMAAEERTDLFSAQIDQILAKAEEGKFLPKQRTKANALIPNVLLADELQKILDTVSSKYDFLLETGVSGALSKKEEIMEVFQFVMPAWIGPLNDDQFGWAVWKDGVTPKESLFPWELAVHIDFKNTRKNYMRRLINDCAYISGEEGKVLPDNSFFVRKAQVLNELNRITIDSKRLPAAVKQMIFEKLFLSYEKVSQKNIEKFLEEKGFLDTGVPHDYTGFTKKKLVHNMAPYIRAKAVKPDITIDQYEAVALAVTIAENERDLMYDIIKTDTDLSDEVINALCNVVRVSQTNAWSNVSKTFLTGICAGRIGGTDRENIIDTLYSSQATLSELLGSGYGFNDEIKRYNEEHTGNIPVKDFIENLNTPPYVKRSFFQLSAILKDIKGYCREESFDEICINLYAPNNLKTRRASVKAWLTKGLTALKEKELLKLLKEEQMPIPQKKVLWYAQLGQDIYTGQPIPYTELMTDKWTIDHIYPKSKIYDRNLSNLVLTIKDENQKKGNTYPVDQKIIEERKPLWSILLAAGLMQQKKFDALTSETGIPLEMKIDAIDQLLIEHRKTALYGATTIIQKVFPKIRVTFVDNDRLNDFKNKYNLVDSGTINQLGYAKDALYTLIVGSVWRNIFTDHPKKYILDNKNYSLNVWNYDSELWNTTGSIKKLDTQRYHFLYTKAQTSNMTGAYADATVYSAKHIQSVTCQVLSKGSPDAPDADPALYGGRKSVATAYYCIINAKIKKERKVVFASIPTYMAKKIRDTDTLLEYLQKKYEDPVILREKVLLLPSIRLGGILYQIRSINGVGALRLVHAEPFTISGSDRYEVIFRAAELVKNESRFSHYAKRHNITAGENIMLYKNFLEEYEERYSGRLNNMLDKLKSHLDDFSNLPVTTQCVVIRNLFGLTASGSTSMADLTALKEAAQAGAINISNASLGNFTLVEMSSTGLFTKETVF